jgi:DNA modification methylase
MELHFIADDLEEHAWYVDLVADFVEDVEEFLAELDKVWAHCFRALVPGGRLICVVGDVCLSRRKNNGRHTVVPLHASIQEHCRLIGFSNVAPIIWHKIANAVFEASGNGGGFLGRISGRSAPILPLGSATARYYRGGVA